MTIKNILSVDWDFFFPDSTVFDWSASETRYAGFYLKMVWTMRAHNHICFKSASHPDLDPETPAIEYMQPYPQLMAGFWDRFRFTANTSLVITESHEDLVLIMDRAPSFFNEEIDGYTVWNFDAHHDMGYGIPAKHSKSPISRELPKLNCGNWALHGMYAVPPIVNYHLIYPEWRKRRDENDFARVAHQASSIRYKIPHIGWDIDIVFVCRSGAWSPSWCDPQWLEFIDWWAKHHKLAWATKVTNQGEVLNMREFNHDEAKLFNEANLAARADAEKKMKELKERIAVSSEDPQTKTAA